MTESEWLTCTDPTPMLEFLRGKASDRKLRLFAVAACRCIHDRLRDERSREAVLLAERFADGAATPHELMIARDRAREAWVDMRVNTQHSGFYDWRDAASEAAVACAASFAYPPTDQPAEQSSYFTKAAGDAANAVAAYQLGLTEHHDSDDDIEVLWNTTRSSEWAQQADLLRDIFGNPFSAPAFDPSWRTSTVVAMARQMYETRDFSAASILADALLDAGAPDDSEILRHLRAAGPHVRGCWALDLVLGKN